MSKTDTLIRTKLRLPYTRPGLVVRPRLHELIQRGLNGPLVLITAPAGFGKTTLAAACAAACGMPVAWLALDKDDNQAERFLQYLVAAVQLADEQAGSEAAQLLATARQAAVEAVLTSLVNSLDAAGKALLLVLDDYQVIRSPEVHQALSFLLEHAPACLHLLIATRVDPPLPLARLRARGLTVELRAADLSFTQPEAGSFLKDVMGLALEPAEVALLAKRTEGWVAGLQMAALSLHNREDTRTFIEGFSGTHRYILDYLLEEVLSGQPEQVQRFLLQTSILERLCAPLCDELLAGAAARRGEAPASPSAPLLEYLERSNLFLLPLDDERQWFRYHQLFADLLRAQLQRSSTAEEVAALHAHAADWHAQHGAVLEAIDHASQAGDEERLERFIEQSYRELVSQGEQAGMRFWTGQLSAEQVHRRPWLCIYEAYSHAWFGELDEADRLLDIAQKRIDTDGQLAEALLMQAHLSYVRSRVAAMRGEMTGAIALCQAARAITPADNLALQLDTGITLGYEYFLTGDYAQALPMLNGTIETCLAGGAVINTVAAYCLVARLYSVQGELGKACETYQAAARCIPEASGQHLGARALVDAGLAEIHCERDELEQALELVQRGLARMPWWGKSDDFVLAHLTQTRIHLARGELRPAQESFAKASEWVQRRGTFSEARQAVENQQARLWLALGEQPALQTWAAELAARHGSGGIPFEQEPAHISLARAWIAQEQPAQALAMLGRLEKQARAAGRCGRVVEILLLQALALEALGEQEAAWRTLQACLALAAPQGYTQIFLESGAPLQALLSRGLARQGEGAWTSHARYLLTRFASLPAHAKASPGGALVEPLSPRELEVLQLLALGKSNREIARQIFVSPGTVKAHTASIYRKLEVANRTQAAARARQLNLLELPSTPNA